MARLRLGSPPSIDPTVFGRTDRSRRWLNCWLELNSVLASCRLKQTSSVTLHASWLVGHSDRSFGIDAITGIQTDRQTDTALHLPGRSVLAPPSSLVVFASVSVSSSPHPALLFLASSSCMVCTTTSKQPHSLSRSFSPPIGSNTGFCQTQQR